MKENICRLSRTERMGVAVTVFVADKPATCHG